MNARVILLLLSLLSILSCKKIPVSSEEEQEKQYVLNTKSTEDIRDALAKLPLTIYVKDEENNKYVGFDIEKREIILNNKRNWDFANPQPNTLYAQAGGLAIFVSSADFSLGSNASTSTVTAGNTTLNVKTICVAVDISAYMAAFGNQVGTLPYDGISLVMGLDADFSLLSNASPNNFANYFRGVAFYYVLDFQASGSYSVIDWTQYTVNNNEGFAFVFSFMQNNYGGFYFSKSGDIVVNGNSMTFNGNYWGIETDFFNINPGLQFQDYSGSGTMGCN